MSFFHPFSNVLVSIRDSKGDFLMKKWQSCLASGLVLGSLCLYPTTSQAQERVADEAREYSIVQSRPPRPYQQNQVDGRFVPNIRQLAHRVSLSLTAGEGTEEVWTAVWSEKDGQDDLVWYRHHWQAGQSLVTLDTHEEGVFHVHTYVKKGDAMLLSDRQVFEAGQPPHYQVTSLGHGQYQLTISYVPEGLVTLYLPIWSSEQGQDDLVWYEAEKVADNSYTLQFDKADHLNNSGHYDLHIYGRQENGHLAGLLATDGFEVEQAVGQTVSTDNTYPVGQCTWGVKEQASWVGNYWGNASDWGASALAVGYELGYEPRVGAVAVWANDGLIDGVTYGHVAYVVGVKDKHCIRVREANYAGQMTVQDYRGWFDPYQAISGGEVYYIYPPERVSD